MGIQIRNLQKRYTGPDGSVVPVIDVADFSLDDGEQVALIGSSGSGKTTLLHLIAGILTPDSGSVLANFPDEPPSRQRGFWSRYWPYVLTAGTPAFFYWFLKKIEAREVKQQDRRPGKTASYVEPAARRDRAGDNVLDYRSAPVLARGPVDLAAMSEAQRDVFRGRYIGYIFQTHHLLPGFTALENVQLGMSFTGRAPDRNWAKHLLEEVGLSERLHYKPEKLSVGQQQRVAVARALANRPKLVLADEPTGALDVNNAQQVLELIRTLCAEVQASLLLVSHDLNIARQLPRVVELAALNGNRSVTKPE